MSTTTSPFRQNLSGCQYCDVPLILSIGPYQRSAYIALDVLWGFSFIALVVFAVLASRFRWTKNDGSSASARTLAYTIAAASGSLYFLMAMVRLALGLAVTRLTGKFYIYDIFTQLLFRISELLILGVLFSVITGKVVRKLVWPFKWLSLGAVGLVTIAAFVVFVAYIGVLLRSGLTQGAMVNRLSDAYTWLDIAYLALYVIATLILLIWSVVFVVSDRTKISGLLVLASLALMVRALIDLAYNAWYQSITYYRNQGEIIRFSLGDGFVYIFMTWIVFGVVAGIALAKPAVPRAKGMDDMAAVVEEGHPRYSGVTY